MRVELATDESASRAVHMPVMPFRVHLALGERPTTELVAVLEPSAPFERTPLTTAFADAEWSLIKQLRQLVTTDEPARAFVRGWRALVETASPDEFPQRRGAVLCRSDEASGTIGAQLLK